MCVKRAGLVWVLVLLTTTCFIFTCAAPTGANGKGSPANYRGPAKDDVIITTTAEPPTVSTTPPVTSTDKVDSSDKNNKRVTETAAGSNDPNGHVPSDAEDLTEKYLYYQIKKCIFEHNLTLSDIQYVLSQKDEEGQFMFALADKLGYMSGGKHNDPHIPVIRSHREKLIELLEKMAAMKESKSHSQQEHNEGPAVSSNEMPASKEPPSPSDIKKMGFEVSTDIRGLGSDAIYDILSDLSFSDILGYAVGIQLGYSPKDEHMKYLENVDAEELKEFLQRILKLKTGNQITPDSSFDSRNGATPSGNSNGGEDPIKEGNGGVNNLQPSQKGKDDLEDGAGVGLVDKKKQNLPPTAKPSSKELGGDVQTTKAPLVSVKSKPGTLDSEERNSGGEYGDHKERPCDGCALYVMVEVDDFDMKGGGEDSNKLEAGGGDEPEAEEGKTVRKLDVHVRVPHFL